MSVLNRDVREIVRDEPAMHRRILEVLAAGPMTVPEVADAIGRPAHEVVFWVMGMRRYGHVREVPGGTADGDGYFRYEGLDKEAAR